MAGKYTKKEFEAYLNRDILECKSIPTTGLSRPAQHLNRDILECKLGSIYMSVNNTNPFK